MKTDSFFAIGHSHNVCEDYADHNDHSVVVSDGCSHGDNSNKYKTDFGSRILTLSAKDMMHTLELDKEDVFAAGVMGSAKSMAFALGLTPESLAATLLVLKANDEYVHGFACGDGIIGGKMRDGNWCITTIEYPSGAPLYLSYLMEASTLGNFIASFGDKVVVTEMVGNLKDPKGYDKNVKTLSLTEQKFNQFVYPIEDFECVFCGTDGVMSFQKMIRTETNKHHDKIPLRESLMALFDFPRFNVKFMRRHLTWQFNKDVEGTIKNQGWEHDDDLGMGAIYCGKA